MEYVKSLYKLNIEIEQAVQLVTFRFVLSGYIIVGSSE